MVRKAPPWLRSNCESLVKSLTNPAKTVSSCLTSFDANVKKNEYSSGEVKLPESGDETEAWGEIKVEEKFDALLRKLVNVRQSQKTNGKRSQLQIGGSWCW